MDLKQLLGKLDLIEGSMQKAAKEPTGPKYTGQWRGTDAGTPGKKLVGDSIEPEESILKDLNKGPKPKTKEKELAEQFEAFLQALEEDNIGVEEKRPARKGSRPARDYGKDGQPSKRYNTVKEHGDPWERDQEGKAVGWRAQEDEENIKAIQANAKKYPNGDPRVKPLKAKDATKIAHDVLGKSFGSEETDESRGHKIVATKLKDIERSKQPTADVDLTARKAQAKAEYRKYVEKMKKLNPNYVPMYKMDETVPTGQQTMAAKTQANGAATMPVDPKQIQAAKIATNTLKTATGSKAPNLDTAVDKLSQGVPDPKSIAALQPMMQDVATIMQDPKLANQLKSVLGQVQQVQKAQQKQNPAV